MVNIKDMEDIAACMQRYVDGCRSGKSAEMRPAFDKGATMYGYLNGELFDGSIEALYKAVDGLGPAPEAVARVDVLAVEGTAAIVRVRLEGWHGVSFTDFHSLLKIDGDWRIAGKVFDQ